ncbi:MAG: hypothetical protein QOJ86_2073, partial [Bradyrhizobium sp.]|nr:hypothetical protein [Bradyrhizobium sp.]
ARAMAEFRARANVSTAGYARRFIERFALAFAAAEEARRCGLLTVSAKQILRALLRLYKRGMKTLPDPERDAKRALKALKERLSGVTVLRLHPGKKVAKADLAAAPFLRRKDPKLGTVYLVRPEAFAQLCGSKAAWGESIRLLRAAGYLVTDGRGLATKQVSLAGSNRKSRFLCIRQGFVDTAKHKMSVSGRRSASTKVKRLRARTVLVYA